MEKTIKLNTDYKENGNSDESQISTLAIATIGQDFNELWEYNIDWIWENEKYVIDNFDYEELFISELSKEKAKELLNKPDSYANALEEYTENLKENFMELDDKHPLTVELQEARDNTEKELYRDFINGDYIGNFSGVLPTAEKDYGIAISYDRKTDVLSADISKEYIEELYDDGHIQKKSGKEALLYLEDSINGDAYSKHKKEMADREKRAEDRKVRKDVEVRNAKEAEQERKEKLNKVIKLKG